MQYDFSGESEQKEFENFGPVPSGSIVVVKMTLLDPGDYADPEEPDISVATTGLRQIYCELKVIRGQFDGVKWRQKINLPAGMQNIDLTDGQRTACNIGGATIKAILEAAKKPPKFQSLKALDALCFPVRVRIQSNPYEKDGIEYWRNEIATVITPAMKEYEQVKREKEIINPDGAVTGQKKPKSGNGGNGGYGGASHPSASGQSKTYFDEINEDAAPPRNSRQQASDSEYSHDEDKVDF